MSGVRRLCSATATCCKDVLALNEGTVRLFFYYLLSDEVNCFTEIKVVNKKNIKEFIFMLLNYLSEVTFL